MPPSTVTTTPNRLRIPQLKPRAMAESDWPKQAAQARAASGWRHTRTAAANTALTIAETLFMPIATLFKMNSQIAHVLELFQEIALVKDQSNSGRHGAKTE